jgi:putative FmdB family regulatory protein
MPLYVYVCQDCQHRFEYLVRNTRQLPTTVVCPKCGSTKTQRAVHDTGPVQVQPDDPTAKNPKTDPFSLKTLGRDLEKKP